MRRVGRRIHRRFSQEAERQNEDGEIERRTDEAGSSAFREANHNTRKADEAIRAINPEGEPPCARRLLARWEGI